MSSSVSTESKDHRRKLIELERQRAGLEEEIVALVAELDSPSMEGAPAPGVNTPLVDIDGFPRSDIDIPAVRAKRLRVNIIRNDLRAIQKEIEVNLLALHSEARALGFMDPFKKAAPVILPTTDHICAEPFARVSDVLVGSPAFNSAIRSGDLIVRFGDVASHNHRNLAALASVVKDNIGQRIEVVVKRPGEELNLVLSVKPQQWEGLGVLGCQFTVL